MRLKTIRTRMAIYIVAFTTLTLFLVGSYVINLYSKQILENLKEITNLNLELVSREIDIAIGDVYQLFQKIQENDELQNLLTEEEAPISSDNSNGDGSQFTDSEKKQGISSILREYAYSDIRIISAFIVDNNKNIQDPFYQIEPYSSIVSSYKPLQDYYQNPMMTFSTIGKFPLKQDSEEEGIKTITFMDELISKDDFSSLGTVLITGKIDYLFGAFKNACNSNFDLVYIINEDNQVIFKSNELFEENNILELNIIEEEIKSVADSGLVNINKSTYYINKKPLDIYKAWTLIGVKEYTTLKANNTNITKLLLIFGVISIPVLILLSYLFARKLTGPIVKLSYAMKEFSNGHWPEKIEVHTKDELEDLVEGFNDMVINQFSLIEQIVHEQEIAKEKEVKTLKLQLELLQSQINPHFIHNTLNAIAYLVRNKQEEKAEEMLKSFNVLLRSSMSHKEDVISLFDEIECVKSYVTIQKVRYDDIFDIEYQVDESLLNVSVPKLILQPLVENSIYHGIVPKRKKGFIIVKIERDNEGYVVISVEDDGVGISPDDYHKEKLLFNGITFENINKRLALTYGEGTCLHIESTIGEGTKAFFRINV